ncbi:MAG: GNAT family N-acetyltransferase [Holophagales bacterium]|nr:GNAT family N-acetyltransferase [Holophagales bacterium]MYC11749.1 GNAT family N-acetyltransferase [Holophagales bacterium]
MTAYRFCRSDDVPLIVDAYERCNVGSGARPWSLTVDHMKRLGREMNLWTSSCMVAFEGSDPIGVLIAAKREPIASLVLHVAVHPDHRRRGHGRHMMTSLGQKMAILEPTLMLVELPDDDALGRRFFEACGFTERDVLTDYAYAGEAPAVVPGVDLVAGVAAAELVSQEDFEVVPELDRCWQRSPLSIRNLRDRPRGLAIATDRGFEAWLLHRGDGDAEKPLPFLAAPPAGTPLEILALGGKMPVPALLRSLLAIAANRAGRSLHLPRVHPSEAPAGRLEEVGFRPGARTIRYESDAAPA